MAGEDVVIRVGVDYSAAIAQTRQFEQELRRILTSAAQVQIGAGSRSQAVGAGGPDLGRELKGINTSLQSLLAVTRQNSQSTPVLAELKGINTSLQSILSVSRQNARGMDASRELRGVTTALQTLVTQTRVSGRGTQSTTSGFDSSRELNRVGNTLQSILALSRQNQGTGNRDSGITELRSIDTSLRSILAISRQGQGNTTTSSGSSQELNQVNKTLQSLVVGSRPGVTVDNSSEFGKLNNSLQTLVAVTRQNTQANRTVVFVEREHRVPATAIAPSPPPTPSAPVEPVRVRVPEPINPLSSRGAFTESRASRELAATQNAYANALRNEIRRFSQPQIAPVSRELPRPAQPAPRPAQAPLGLPRPVQTPPSQMPLADFLAAQRVLTQPRSVVQAAELGVETGPVTRPVRRRYISPDLADFRQQYSLQERVQSLASRSREYRSALPKIDQTLAPQNFAGMERKYVEQIRLTMKRLFSWFPEVAKDLAFVGTPAGTLDSPLPPRMKKGIAYSSGRKSSTTAAINIAPEYGSKGGSIIFNPSEAGSFMDLAKTLPRAFMGGSFAGDLGVSSLAVHEFGHSLDRVRGGGGTLDALSKRNNAGNDRLLAQSISEISQYASTNVQELYAEAFSQSLSAFPSELGRRIYQEMAGHRAGDPGRRAEVLASETNKFSGLTGIQSGWSEAIDLRREALGRILSPTAQAISSGNVQAMSLGRPILEPGLSDRVLYHGTTLSPFGEIPDVIRPSGGSLVHPGTTDPRYAYATPDPSSAMAYAEMAYQSRGQGFPAVLKVVPIGSIEEDPRVDANGMNRGNFKDDVRSLSGFRVVGKLPLDDEEEWLEPNEISAYHRKLEQYRELERATSTTPGGSALDTRNEIERYGQARRTRRAIEAEVQSVLPSSGQPIAAGKDLWSRLSDREAAALRFALDMKKPPTPGVSSGVFKPDEVIPPTVRGPEYGPHFSESRPVIETTGRALAPLEAEFRRRDAARAQREQIQSQLRAQTEAQVKSIPASTTKTTTDIVAAQRDYIAGVRRATKAHEAEARSVLPSGDKPTALGSGRHPGDYSFQEWMKRPDVYSHATMVEGFDQGPLTHFGNVDQSLALTRGRFGKPSDVGLTRRELLSDGFGVTNPRLYSRRIARGNLFPGGISDQAANDAHLLFAADKGQLGEVRKSIRDSVSSVADEIAGELDSWMDSAEEELLAYRQTNPAVDQAMSAFEGGQGVTYENIGEGYGNSIVVPRTAVGTSYFEDVLASPNRPQELKDAIRAALGGEVPYSPYSPIHNAPVRLGDPATDYSLLQNHQIREMLGLESKASTALVLARNQYASEYRKATAQLRAATTLELPSTLGPIALGVGGAGAPPRKPPTNALGGGNWEDEFRRREIARQQREQMRRWLDAEAARTLRPVSETEMNAYKWRQGVIANTPPGAERTRRLLSGSPVGPDTPAPKALRYVSEEEMNAYKWRQKVISTVPSGAQRTKYLLGKDGQAQFEADQAVAKWRQNIMDTIPPGATRTKYLLGKDPFNLGSLDLTNNSGSGTPAAIAAFRRDVEADATRLMGPSLPEFKKSVRGMGGGRRGALDEQLDLAATIEPTQALASINEVLAQIGKLRTAVTTPMRLNFVSGASEQVKAEQSYVIQSLDEIEARANSLAKSKRAALPAATGGGEKTNDIPPTSTQGLESENKKTGATQSTPEVRGSIPTQDTLGTPPTFRDTAGVRREIKDHLAAAKRSLSDTDKLANVEAAEEKIRGLERSVNIPIGANTTGFEAGIARIKAEIGALRMEAQNIRIGIGSAGLRVPALTAAPVGGGAGGGRNLPTLFEGNGGGGFGGGFGRWLFSDRQPHQGPGAFTRLLRSARGAGGALGFFGTGALSTLRYGLPSMALYGAAGGISAGVREANQFTFTMQKVKAQLEDTFGQGSDKIFDEFKGRILDLSRTTGVQADELASLGMQFQGAFGSESIGGLSGQALVNSQLDAAAKLSQVTKIPAKELTDGLTAASFGFGRTNEDIGNVALRLESLSGVTANETIGFIGDIAPVAKEAGFSLEEFASLAAVAQQKSGRSGTALAESFGRIIPAISQSKDQLLQLAAADDGLRTPAFIEAINSGTTKDVLLEIVKNFKNLNSESKDFIVNLLGGRREAQVLLAAVGDQGQIERYTEGAKDSSGVLEERFKNAQETLTIQLQKLRQQFNLLIVSLMEGGLSDVFSGLLTGAGLLVKALEGVMRVTGAINDLFGGWPGKILGVIAAVKLLTLGFKALTGVSVLQSAPWFAANTARAERTFAGPIGGFTGGFASRSAAARTAWETTKLNTGGVLTFPQNDPNAYGVPVGGSNLRAGAAGAKAFFKGAGPFLALAGLVAAYAFIRSGIDEQNANLDEVQRFAQDTNTSISDLEKKARNLRRNTGGPSLGSRLSTLFTGEHFLSESDLADAELVNKKINEEKKALYSSLEADVEQTKELRDKLFGTDESKQGRRAKELVEDIDVDKQSGFRAFGRRIGLGDITSVVTKPFGWVTGREGDSNALFDKGEIDRLRADTDDPRVKQELRFVERTAELAGVKPEGLSESVLNALGRKNPMGALNDIVNNVDQKYNKNVVAQAEKLRSALGEGATSSEIFEVTGAIKSEQANQTLDTIQKNFQAGVIGFDIYIERTRVNVDNQRQIIEAIQKGGGTPSDKMLQDYFSSLRALKKAISEQAAKVTDINIETFEVAGRTPLESAQRRVEEYTRLIAGGKLSGEDRRKYVNELIKARQTETNELLKSAKSLEDVEAIASRGFKISDDERVSSVIGAVGEISGNWERFSKTFKDTSGETAGEFIGSLVRGVSSGRLAKEDVVKALQAQITMYSALIDQLLQNGLDPQDPEITKYKSAIDALKTILDQFNTTGTLPGDPGGVGFGDPAQVLQGATSRIEATANLAKALAGGDSLAKAQAGVKAASDALAAVKKYTPDDQVAIDNATARLLEAESEERNALRDRSRAILDRNKLFAQARHDSVAAAGEDVKAAMFDLQAARQEGDPAGVARAEGQLAVSLDAQRQQRINIAIQLKRLAAARNSKGDSIQDAVSNLDIARFSLANAVGDDRIQALLDLQAAEKAARDSLISRYKALRELEKAKQNDPVASANTDLQTAQTLLSVAQNEDEKIDAQRQLIDAERALQQAMSDVRDSKYDLRAAELAAMGDDVGSAQVQAQKARAQLQEALGLAAQGKGGGEAELNRLRAAVVSADKSASDAAFNDKLDDYKFMYEMGTLTKMEYVNYLEGLKSTLIPGTKQFKDLELTIKQLKDDISGGLQMNLPTSLALPTLYEVRRLNQSVGADGQAAGYNDNRVVTITLNINNGADQAEMINVLNQALGTGTSGRDPRLY